MPKQLKTKTTRTRTRTKVRTFLIEEFVKGSLNTNVVRIKGTTVKITGQDGEFPMLWIYSASKVVYTVPLIEVRRVLDESVVDKAATSTSKPNTAASGTVISLVSERIKKR